MTTPRRTNPAIAPAPLAAVLALTALGSLGTGAITNGVVFLAESAFGFDAARNNWLMLALGVVYAAAAFGAGPVLRKAIARVGWLTTRRALAGAVLAVAACCVLPVVGDRLGLGEWGLWALVAVFSPATAVMWPICESYLSGGRRGQSLRGAVGRFNIVWSVAMVAAMWLMAPVVEAAPLTALLGVGVLHFLALGTLRWFPVEPPAHDEDAWEHEPHTDSYQPLLRAFRVGLPISYILLSALVPLLPTTLSKLGVEIGWKTPVASVWMASRVLSFLMLERWHGWHGRASAPVLGGVCLAGGFAMSVLAPLFPPSAGLVVLIGGLGVFGLGMAVVYVGALYYALECGQGEVDAGGTHEGLIGIGYTLGPACGLAALWIGRSGWVSAEWALVWLVVGVSVVGGGLGWWWLTRERSKCDPS